MLFNSLRIKGSKSISHIEKVILRRHSIIVSVEYNNTMADIHDGFNSNIPYLIITGWNHSVHIGLLACSGWGFREKHIPGTKQNEFN